MAQTRCGISAKQLERELGVTYKTAWRMFKQIRSMLDQGDDPMGGTVEADETYVGGKRRNATGRPGGHDSKKTPVFGIAQRGSTNRPGKVVAKVVPDASGPSLMPHLRKRVLPASTVYTDEWKPYLALGREGYSHSRINHTQGVYVDGDVHTNTIEGFWALLKGGLRGVYHGVSAKHLQSYLDEYVYRYNHRDAPGGMFRAMLARVTESVPV
jgi:transposase